MDKHTLAWETAETVYFKRIINALKSQNLKLIFTKYEKYLMHNNIYDQSYFSCVPFNPEEFHVVVTD